MLFLASCAKTQKDDRASENTVASAVESQLSVINSATSDVNTGNSTIISSLTPYELDQLRGTLFDRAIDYLRQALDSSLHALPFSCSSGSVSDNASPNFGAAASLTVTRTWSNCVGDAGQFRRNGVVYLGWSGLNMSTPYVQSGTTLKRATNGLTMTRVSTGNYVEISGNDTSNQVSGYNGNQVLSWTSVSGSNRSFTLAINETRTGKSSGGATLFQHIVTTPTNLTINVDTGAATRTIASGTVRVQYQLAGITVDTTFNSAVWNIDTCQPVSGSATVSVSGAKSGTGSMTFNNGTVTFSFEGSNSTLTLPGC